MTDVIGIDHESRLGEVGRVAHLDFPEQVKPSTKGSEDAVPPPIPASHASAAASDVDPAWKGELGARSRWEEARRQALKKFGAWDQA